MTGLAAALLATGLILWLPVWVTVWSLRTTQDQTTSRAAFGRMRVDPQYVRDQFAEIVKGNPELHSADPRLLSLYVIPPANEED